MRKCLSATSQERAAGILESQALPVPSVPSMSPAASCEHRASQGTRGHTPPVRLRVSSKASGAFGHDSVHRVHLLSLGLLGAASRSGPGRRSPPATAEHVVTGSGPIQKQMLPRCGGGMDLALVSCLVGFSINAVLSQDQALCIPVPGFTNKTQQPVPVRCMMLGSVSPLPLRG